MRIPTFVAPLLAWLILPTALAGWNAAQSFAGPPTQIVDSDPIIHTYATSTYAVVLFISGLVNAIIVTARARSLRWAPVSQGFTLLVAGGWLACILSGDEAQSVEMILGLALAGASIGAFIIAATMPGLGRKPPALV